VEQVRDRYQQARVIQRTAPKRDVTVSDLAEATAVTGEPLVDLPRLDIDPLLERHHLETAFGTLVHRVLSDRLAGAADERRDGRQESWQDTRPDELSEADAALLLTRAEKLCDDFFSSELGRFVDRATVESEFPFVYFWEQGPLFINGQIDLLLQTEQTVRVIDFKTDRHFRRGAHGFQLGLYALAAEQLYPGKIIEPYLFYLRAARTIALEPGWRGRVQQALESKHHEHH
jgi:ATP-dependent exoDNAse (exonuclease V) beta subunit